MSGVRSSDQTLLPEFVEIHIIKFVREGYHSLVKPVVAGFVSTDQQDRGTPWIECVENPDRMTGALHPQFPHVTMPGIFDAGGMRKRQIRTNSMRSSAVAVMSSCCVSVSSFHHSVNSSVFSTFQVMNKIFHRGNKVNNYSVEGMQSTIASVAG
jgi:hypothetical protein